MTPVRPCLVVSERATIDEQPRCRASLIDSINGLGKLNI